MNNKTNKTMEKQIAVNEISVSYKKQVIFDNVKDSAGVYKNLLKIWDTDTLELYECMYLLLMNYNNEVISYCKISEGDCTATLIPIKKIFQIALKGNATAIILAHNHPTGNLNPSRNDIQNTKKINDAAKLLEINLLDHIIVTSNGHYSLADNGLL